VEKVLDELLGEGIITVYREYCGHQFKKIKGKSWKYAATRLFTGKSLTFGCGITG
jgi:hypothetical protein